MIIEYSRCIRLHEAGLNCAEISRSMRVSRPVISKILKQYKALSLTSANIKDMDESEICDLLFPPVNRESQNPFGQPDYKYFHGELAKKGVTMLLLHDEYKKQCFSDGKKAYQYSRFCQLYREWADKKHLIMRIAHKPGDRLEVDWAGYKPFYTDPVTGNKHEVSVFVAALPYSLYFFYEVCPDEREITFISAHIHAFEFFGGVTRLLVPDNLKTGVKKHKRLDIQLNKDYTSLSDYYDTAVVPTRVREPKDKSHAESSVKTVEHKLLAPLRNKEFTRFEEIVEEVDKNAEALMKSTVPVLGCSRKEYYEKEERQFMKPLPQVRYEPHIWSTWSVQRDYTVQADKNWYSVPYQYAGKKVDICLTQKEVKVYKNFKCIAVHERLPEHARFPKIAPEHMPPNHRAMLDYTEDGFRNYMKSVGPETMKVFESILEDVKEPEQAFPNCASLKNLGEKYGNSRLEAACAAALQKETGLKLTDIDYYVKHPEAIPKPLPDSVPESVITRQHAQIGMTRGASQFGS